MPEAKELKHTHDRGVRLTLVGSDGTSLLVSTVSLYGADNFTMSFAAKFMGYATQGYETMVFRSNEDAEWLKPMEELYTENYETEDEARLGHERIVEDFLKGRAAWLKNTSV